MLKVKDVIAIIEEKAKPEYAYEWDNCGLCCGSKEQAVKNIMISLDITCEVVLEAAEKKCEMIISHHPLIFKAIKKANEDSYEGEILSLLYKNGIALYSAHTSLDIASGGVNDSLCQLLELKNVKLLSPFEVNGEQVACAREGELPCEMNGEQLKKFVSEKLHTDTLLCGGLKNKKFLTAGLCTGAGEEFAFDTNADVFITGEIKYHTALEMKRQNKSFIAAGHYFTEQPVVHDLADGLQKRLNMLQYNVNVFESNVNTNPFDDC